MVMHESIVKDPQEVQACPKAETEKDQGKFSSIPRSRRRGIEMIA